MHPYPTVSSKCNRSDQLFVLRNRVQSFRNPDPLKNHSINEIWNFTSTLPETRKQHFFYCAPSVTCACFAIRTRTRGPKEGHIRYHENNEWNSKRSTTAREKRVRMGHEHYNYLHILRRGAGKELVRWKTSALLCNSSQLKSLRWRDTIKR